MSVSSNPSMSGGRGAETIRDLFVVGARNAHALEKEALQLIDRQLDRLESFPMVASRLRQHRDETERQHERLDRILEGGFLVPGVYIVQGPPGAGKTILANQTCFNHAAAGGHAVYVTLLAESHSRMFAHLKRMAFFDESAIPDRVYYIGGYSALEAEGLDALVTLIRGAIQKQKATLLVVDGLVWCDPRASLSRETSRAVVKVTPGSAESTSSGVVQPRCLVAHDRPSIPSARRIQQVHEGGTRCEACDPNQS